jgi:hypothetical protein
MLMQYDDDETSTKIAAAAALAQRNLEAPCEVILLSVSTSSLNPQLTSLKTFKVFKTENQQCILGACTEVSASSPASPRLLPLRFSVRTFTKCYKK